MGSVEPPIFKDIDMRAIASEDDKIVNRMSLQNEVSKYFGIKAVREGSDNRRTVEQHLRPFVIEKQPEETQRAVQELMGPYSLASMQLLTTYMALLLSNELVMDQAVQAFLARAKEMHHLGNLKPLFAQSSPSARAVATRILHAAICIDATKFLSQALKSGVDVESPSTGEESLTLLQEALKWGKYEAARILIDAGANVNAGASARHKEKAYEYAGYQLKNCVWNSEIEGLNFPVSLAAQSVACVELIPELVRKGAIILEHDRVIVDAIEMKASVDTVSYLISAGADVNGCLWSQIGDVKPPLSAAARRRNLQVVRILLEAGANPNGPLNSELSQVCDPDIVMIDWMQSPLLCAINQWSNHGDNSRDIVRLLLEFGANPNISLYDIIVEQGTALTPDSISDLFGVYDRDEAPALYPLQAAVKYDDVELVKLLLQHKASANSAYGTPALALAISHSNTEMVRLLLSQDADPNGLSKQPYCQSALEVAVDEENLELIDLLLQSGADINNGPAPHGGRTPLQRAAENGENRVIEHLLTRGASILSQPAPVEGSSVLQGFIRNGLHKYVSEALNAGASPDGGSRAGSSPLAVAVIHGDAVSLDLLLFAGANVHKYAYSDYRDRCIFDDILDYKGKLQLSPIQWTAIMNDVEIGRILCEAGANVNQPPCTSCSCMALHLAAIYNNSAIAKFLVEQKAEVGACSNGETTLTAAIEGESDSVLNLLLKNGADPNQPSCVPSGMLGSPTALDRACYYGSVSAVRALLRAGADTSQGIAVWSVCSCSEFMFDGSEREILGILLQYGADVNKRYSNKSTPLQEAILLDKFHCADRLIKAGAYINAHASTSKRGCTALQAAASVGNIHMVERLLLAGADVNATAAQVDGVTALQAAAIKGYLRIAQILLEHGAVIDAAAGIENGRTAIEGAAEFGRMNIVKFLLDNYQGPTPIPELLDGAHRAAKKGNQWFVMELLSAYEHPGEAWP